MTDLAVTAQAVLSGAFLIQYSSLCKWWKTVSGRMIGGLVASLLIITMTLTITETDEGLTTNPLPVTIGRLGFIASLIYGIIALEYKRRKRNRLKKAQAEDDDETAP